MKKIFIVILMFFSLSLISCKYTKDGNYDFIEKEDVENALSNYYAIATLVNASGTLDTFTLVENEAYFYYNYKEKYYLVDKVNNNLYSIDHDEKLKLLEQKFDFDYIANKKVLVDLLVEHIEVVDSKFQMSNNTLDISGFDCYEYTKTTKVDNDNYIKKSYFVDELSGYCIKVETEVRVKETQTITGWSINELKLNGDVANNYIDNINNYEEGVAAVEFDSWPDMGLGILLPECKSGTFMFAVDYGYRATISIEEISLQEVKSYTANLTNYGFNAGKSTTNESSQFIYVTYNNDNILVKTSYTPTLKRFTIRISQSTQEEINAELGKL